MEKKTIKEAAEWFANNYFDMHETNSYQELKKGFIKGAEWYAKNQSEQSEDEIIQLKVENQNLINEIHQLRTLINSLIGWKTYAK